MSALVKKILRTPQRFVVRPAPGWSNILTMEIEKILKNPLGKYKFDPILVETPSKGIKISNCDFRQGMEITCRLLSAHDVEWIVGSAMCKSRGELHRFLRKVPLEAVIKESRKRDVSLQCHSNVSFVNSSSLIREMIQAKIDTLTPIEDVSSDGILEDNSSLTTDGVIPNIRLRASFFSNVFTLRASMAGAKFPLFKRGYKKDMSNAHAPLPEHHAAACYLSAIQQFAMHETPNENTHSAVSRVLRNIREVYVPFAGTGTLGFEALLASLHVGGSVSGNRRYSFEGFPVTPLGTAQHVRRAHLSRSFPSTNAVDVLKALPRVVFSDSNEDVVRSIERNIASFVDTLSLSECALENRDLQLQLRKKIAHPSTQDFLKCDPSDFLQSPSKHAIRGHNIVSILLNPPYGQRMAKESGAENIYAAIGRKVCLIQKRLHANSKSKGPIVLGYILCPDETTWTVFTSTLRQAQFHTNTSHFTHGGNDTRFVAFWK